MGAGIRYRDQTGQCVKLTTHLQLVLMLIMSGALSLRSLRLPSCGVDGVSLVFRYFSNFVPYLDVSRTTARILQALPITLPLLVIVLRRAVQIGQFSTSSILFYPISVVEPLCSATGELVN
jgi:hypothetical protein